MPTAPARRPFPTLRRVVLIRESADRPDADLLTAFVRDRDGDAFAVLVRRHGPMVLGVCRRVVGDHHAADDAFQAVFLVLARRAAAVRPRSAVGNWLYGVAYKTAVKARMVRARRHARERQVDAMPEPPDRSRDDVWADLRPVIDEELARLPDRLRLPVVLCDLEGRPQRAVAQHLGVAPATLAGRLAQARRTLAARLTRRGVTLSGGALAALLTERAAGAVGPALAGGVVRAAEAVVSGGVVAELVSAHAVDLCEGVMRMVLLSKLKAAGAGALAVLALTGGLGYGPGLVAAGDGPGDGPKPGADAPRSPKTDADAAFLDRLSTELRGDKATPVEHGYFAADADRAKRKKVVAWFLADDAVKAHQAKKHGAARPLLADPLGVAFAPDGRRLATTDTGGVRVWEVADRLTVTGKVVTLVDETVTVTGPGTVVMNERYADVTPADPTRGDVLVFKYPHPPAVNAIKRVGGDPPAADPKPADLDAVYLRWVDDLVPYLQMPDQPAANTFVVPQLGAHPIRLDFAFAGVADTDEAFLERATQAARGTGPSEVEKKYFAADADPKKREKLLDLLLKDPAVAKKVGDDWKANMLAPPATTLQSLNAVERYNSVARVYLNSLPPARRLTARVEFAAPPPADKSGKLIDALMAANRTDEQVLEAVTLAAAGRLPTDTETRLVLAAVTTAADKKAAWVEVARALAPADGKK